jgi:polyphosphate kinase
VRKLSKIEFLSNRAYEQELERLQIELVKLQEWVKLKGLKVIVIFEGRDAAGKGGAIKRITERLNPRVCRVVALGIPSDREKSQWYFQRYVQHLPTSGEIVLFDRSWYNRAGVEKVMGFCTDEEYQEFLRSCPEFEKMLVQSGTILIKYWFSVSDDEQERRFQDRMDDPTKRWKISPIDLESRKYWVDYSRAKDEMMEHTDIKVAPWYVVPSDNKKHARINCISHLLSIVPYEDIQREKLELPEKQVNDFYMRPPMDEQTFVPDVASQIANEKNKVKREKIKKVTVKEVVVKDEKAKEEKIKKEKEEKAKKVKEAKEVKEEKEAKEAKEAKVKEPKVKKVKVKDEKVKSDKKSGKKNKVKKEKAHSEPITNADVNEAEELVESIVSFDVLTENALESKEELSENQGVPSDEVSNNES